MKELIEYLERKIELCTEMEMPLEKFAYTDALKKARALQLLQTGVSTRFTLFKEEKPNSPSQILAITDKGNFYMVDYENFLGNDILETNADFLPDEKYYYGVIKMSANVILLVAVAKKSADFGANTTNTKQTFN